MCLVASKACQQDIVYSQNLFQVNVCSRFSSSKYEGRPLSKERFVIPSYSLIIIQKLNIEVWYILCLLFEIVAFDIDTCHTLAPVCVGPIPCSYHVAADSILLVFIICEAVTSKVLLHFWKQEKNPKVPGPDCTEDARRCPNGIAHAARIVSAGQYADVHFRATEQFHAEACLFGKITCDFIGLQKTNNTSHITVGGILNRHSHGHSYVCTYHVTNLTTAWSNFQHRTEHTKPAIGCNKTGAWTVCANVVYLLDGLRILHLKFHSLNSLLKYYASFHLFIHFSSVATHWSWNIDKMKTLVVFPSIILSNFELGGLTLIVFIFPFDKKYSSIRSVFS